MDEHDETTIPLPLLMLLPRPPRNIIKSECTLNDCLQLTLLHDLHLNPSPGAVVTRHQSTVDSFFFPWHQTLAEASFCTGILNHDRSHQAT